MVSLLATNAIHSFAKRMKNAFDVMTSASLSAWFPVEQTRFERSLVKSVSKLYLQVALICQNRYLVSYQRVPCSIPGRGSIDYFSFFPPFLSLFWLGSPSVPLEFPKLTNTQPSNFGPYVFNMMMIVRDHGVVGVHLDSSCLVHLFWPRLA